MKQTVGEAAKEMCEAWGMEDNHGYGVKDTFQVGFAQGAQWQAKQSPWISVKERLPEPEQEVLLYDVDSVKHYAIGWLRKKKGYCKSKWFVINGYVTDDSITHWMSIVEPK